MATPKEEIAKFTTITSTGATVPLVMVNTVNSLYGGVTIATSTDFSVVASTVGNTVTISPTSNIPRTTDILGSSEFVASVSNLTGAVTIQGTTDLTVSASTVTGIIQITPTSNLINVLSTQKLMFTDLKFTDGIPLEAYAIGTESTMVNESGPYVVKFDLTDFTYARIMACPNSIVSSTVIASASIIARYSTDMSSWTGIDGSLGPSVNFTSTNENELVISDFITISTNAKKDVFLAFGVALSSNMSSTDDNIQLGLLNAHIQFANALPVGV